MALGEALYISHLNSYDKRDDDEHVQHHGEGDDYLQNQLLVAFMTSSHPSPNTTEQADKRRNDGGFEAFRED